MIPRPVAVAAAAQSAAQPEVSLVTVPGVELLEVGEDWETSTGIFTFTADDVRSAVEASNDPGVRTPVIKLGHTDPRFDGQPSWGRILNLRTINNDQTLVGDLVGIPSWLASCMASAYPRRSIEGLFNLHSRTGNTWDFALTGVALLGDAYPAIDTLEDIAMMWGSTPPTLVPAEDVLPMVASGNAEHFVAFRRGDMPQWRRVAAGTTSFADLPLAPQDTSWSASAAKSNIRDWASSDGSGDTSKIDWTKFGQAFLWKDANGGDKMGDYKLPYADVIDGKLTAVWRGIAAAAGRVDSTDLPEDDVTSVKGHIAKYYDKASKEFSDDTIAVPWEVNSSSKSSHSHPHSHDSGGTFHTHAHSHANANYDHTGADPEVPHTHSHEKVTSYASAPVKAAVSVEDLRRTYYETLGSGEMWWWIRELQVDPPQLIVDDDEGGLYQVPYTIKGSDITFGEPEKVEIQYTPVKAGRADVEYTAEGLLVAAKWGSADAAGRPDREGSAHPVAGAATVPSNDPKEGDVKLSEEALKKLGLAADASEEQVNAAILAAVGTPPPEGAGEGATGPAGGVSTPPAGDTTPPAGSDDHPAPPTGDTPPPATGPAVQIPPGMVLVDAEQWTQVQDGVAAAIKIRDESAVAARTYLLEDAVKAGKFPRSRMAHYEKMYLADPEGTTSLISTMASGLVPVQERGVQGGADRPDDATVYPEAWKRSVAASNRGATRSRVRVLGD